MDELDMDVGVGLLPWEAELESMRVGVPADSEDGMG